MHTFLVYTYYTTYHMRGSFLTTMESILSPSTAVQNQGHEIVSSSKPNYVVKESSDDRVEDDGTTERNEDKENETNGFSSEKTGEDIHVEVPNPEESPKRDAEEALGGDGDADDAEEEGDTSESLSKKVKVDAHATESSGEEKVEDQSEAKSSDSVESLLAELSNAKAKIQETKIALGQLKESNKKSAEAAESIQEKITAFGEQLDKLKETNTTNAEALKKVLSLRDTANVSFQSAENLLKRIHDNHSQDEDIELEQNNENSNAIEANENEATHATNKETMDAEKADAEGEDEENLAVKLEDSIVSTALENTGATVDAVMNHVEQTTTGNDEKVADKEIFAKEGDAIIAGEPNGNENVSIDVYDEPETKDEAQVKGDDGEQVVSDKSTANNNNNIDSTLAMELGTAGSDDSMLNDDDDEEDKASSKSKGDSDSVNRDSVTIDNTLASELQNYDGNDSDESLLSA